MGRQEAFQIVRRAKMLEFQRQMTRRFRGWGHENSLNFPSDKTESPKVFEAGSDVTYGSYKFTTGWKALSQGGGKKGLW